MSVAFSLGGGAFSADTIIDSQGDGFALADLDGDGRPGVLLNAVDSSGSLIYWKFVDGGFVRKVGPQTAGFAVDKIAAGRFRPNDRVGLALINNVGSLVEFVLPDDSDGGWTMMIVDAGIAMRVGCQPAVGNPVPGWVVGPVLSDRDGIWLNDDTGVIAWSLVGDGGVEVERYGTDSFQAQYDIAVGGEESGTQADIVVLGNGVGVGPSIVGNGGLVPVSNISCSCRARMILADINGDGFADLVCTDIQSSGDFGASAAMRVTFRTDGGGWCPASTIDAGWACEVAVGNYRGTNFKDLVVGSDTGYYFVGEVR